LEFLFLFLLTGETDQHGKKLKNGFDSCSAIILTHNFFLDVRGFVEEVISMTVKFF